jgi:putative ABC transport system ATP-binding protein
MRFFNNCYQLTRDVPDYKETTASHAGLSITHWKIDITERVFLHGNSGSGKTTLLNLLSGILIPMSGSVSLFDNNIGAL